MKLSRSSVTDENMWTSNVALDFPVLDIKMQVIFTVPLCFLLKLLTEEEDDTSTALATI